MGNYLSREAILSKGVKTADVDAFGGTVMVCEMDAALVMQLLKEGVFAADANGNAVPDLSKIDFVAIAQHVIVDPEHPNQPLLMKKDLEALGRSSFSDIQAAVTKAIEITDFGTEAEGEAESGAGGDADPN